MSAEDGTRPLWLGSLQELERTGEPGGAVRVTLRVPPADHAVFEGHFAGDPLLPGWLQIALVQELCRSALDVETTGVSGVRFRGAVRPGDELVATIDGVRFDVATAAGTAASGRLVLVDR